MKVAIVTGSSKGLGLAISLELLKKGIFVFGGSRNASSIEHESFYDIELDIRKPKSVEAFFNEISQKTEVIDYLIHCAGICDMDSIKDTLAEDVLNNFTTNSFGSFLLFKNFEDFILEEETKILNFFSYSPFENNEKTLSYSMSEAAKKSLSEILRKEWNKYELSITDIHLPAVATSLWDQYEGIDTDDMLEISDVLELCHLLLFNNLKINEIKIG